MIAFVLVGLAAIAAAIGVISARNTVHSVLWLIAHLCSLAVLYMTLQAPFLGLVQVLLYAGAVMVLFLFVIGLLSARGDATEGSTEQPRGQVAFASGAAIIFAAIVLIGAAGGSLAQAGALPTGYGSVSAFGQALFGPYLLPFEGTALGLLVAIVGVVSLSHGHDEAHSAGLQPPAEPEDTIDVSHTAATPVGAAGGRRQ